MTKRSEVEFELFSNLAEMLADVSDPQSTPTALELDDVLLRRAC